MSAGNPFEGLNFDPKNMQGPSATNQQAELQNQMATMQKMLAAIEAEGSAGVENYAVKIRLNGRHEAIKTTIDQQLLTQPTVLCDLITAAITDASHKVEAAIQSKMMGLLKDFKLPG